MLAVVVCGYMGCFNVLFDVLLVLGCGEYVLIVLL